MPFSKGLHVRFSMKHHFATEQAARDAVDDYIRAWELDAVPRARSACLKVTFRAIRDRGSRPEAGHQVQARTTAAGTIAAYHELNGKTI